MKLYTIAEIKAKVASNEYNAELMLQHALQHLEKHEYALNALKALVACAEPHRDRKEIKAARQLLKGE